MRPDILTMARAYERLHSDRRDRRLWTSQEAFADSPLVHVNTYAATLSHAPQRSPRSRSSTTKTWSERGGARARMRAGLEAVRDQMPWPSRASVIRLLEVSKINVPAAWTLRGSGRTYGMRATSMAWWFG